MLVTSAELGEFFVGDGEAVRVLIIYMFLLEKQVRKKIYPR